MATSHKRTFAQSWRACSKRRIGVRPSSTSWGERLLVVDQAASPTASLDPSRSLRMRVRFQSVKPL